MNSPLLSSCLLTVSATPLRLMHVVEAEAEVDFQVLQKEYPQFQFNSFPFPFRSRGGGVLLASGDRQNTLLCQVVRRRGTVYCRYETVA